MKHYILIHEGRHGLKLYRFSSQKVLTEGLTVTEDLKDWQRDLLRFLMVAVEFEDHIILRAEPASEGVW